MAVLHLSDLHLRADPAATVWNRHPADTLDRVTDAVLTSLPAPDAVVVTGDIADAAEPGAYERAASAVADFDAPASWLPGNHDRRDRMAEALGYDGPWSEPAGTWRLVGLDSLWPGHDEGYLGSQQLDWLRDRLDAAPEPHVGLFLHHPPHSPCPAVDGCGLADAAPLLDLLHDDGRARFVASGHAHRSFELRTGGIRFYGAPSTVLQLEHHDGVHPQTDEGGGFQYLWLHADGRVDRHVAHT